MTSAAARHVAVVAQRPGEPPPDADADGDRAGPAADAQLLRAVLAHVDAGVVVQSPDGAVLLANDAAARILGVAPARLLAAPPWSARRPPVRGDGSAWVERDLPEAVALRTGLPQRCDDLGVHRPDGEVQWLSVTAAPLELSGDTPPRLVVVTTFTDVTRERTAALALADRERRLVAAQQLAGLAWWEYDVATDRHRWSPQMYALVGRDPAAGEPDLAGFLAMIHPGDRPSVDSVLAGTASAGRQAAFRVRRPDGAERTLQALSEAQLGDDGRVVRLSGTTLDVTDRCEGERDLRESQARLRDAQELTGLAWWEWDLRTGALTWSDGMYRLVGLEPGSSAATIEAWQAMLDPGDAAESAELERAAVASGEGYRHVFRVRPPDGRLRYLQAWTAPVTGADGAVRALRGATLDVTEREDARRALAESEARFRLAFDRAPTGMALLSLAAGSRGRIVQVNAAMCRMLGHPADAVVGMDIADWTFPEDLEADRRRVERVLGGEVDSLAYEKRYRHRDGHAVHALVSIGLTTDAAGRPLHLVAHAVDLTEQRAHREQLERLALTDTLTGLANRSLFEDRARHALARLAREPGHVALLLLDLDRFKLVNDSLGHQVGDALLVEVARRLQSVTRASNLVARLGGDEFVVLVEHVRDVSEVDTLAERILAALRAPVVLPSGEVLVATCSVGIATTAEAGTTTGELFREADLALYRAKDTGRDRAAAFDAELRSRAVARLDVEGRLRRALAGGGLRLVAQPVVAMAGRSPVGVEALVRLADPQRGLLPPAVFLAVAEDTGLVTDVDDWVVETVLAALAGSDPGPWPGTADPRAGGAGPAYVAVNVSARTLRRPGFTGRLRAALARHGVEGHRLHVELPERCLLDPGPALATTLTDLRAAGVRVGIDDFGTGHSALAHLTRYELDFLKVDRSFVARLGDRPESDAIVAAIIDLAHAHHLTVTAEGVETEAQAELLLGMGCDHGQGWLFGRPA